QDLDLAVRDLPARSRDHRKLRHSPHLRPRLQADGKWRHRCDKSCRPKTSRRRARARHPAHERGESRDETPDRVRLMLIGLDVGPAGLKGIAIDERGAVVASSSREYPLYSPRPTWAEQDGIDFENAAIAVLSELAQNLGARKSQVRAIGLTGQMHSA